MAYTTSTPFYHDKEVSAFPIMQVMGVNYGSRLLY